MSRSWDLLRGRLLKMAEKERGFQAKLAKKLDLYPTAVSKYLNNEHIPGLAQLDKIADALQVHPWELIRPENEKERIEPLLNRIITIWGGLNEDERGTVVRVAEGLSNAKTGRNPINLMTKKE